MKEKINDMINKNIRLIESKFSESELYDIKNLTNFLDKNVSLSERCYNIINSINSQILCLQCNSNKTVFLRISSGYRKFCSCECKNKYVYNNTDTRRKISETILIYHNNLSKDERRIQQNKRLDTLIKNEHITAVCDRDPFKYYSSEVWRYTNEQDLKSLKDFDKRGHVSIKNSYHLDHKYSIFRGFIDKIDAKIIGNICNLEMIPSIDNCSKKGNISISKEELLKNYNELMTKGSTTIP